MLVLLGVFRGFLLYFVVGVFWAYLQGIRGLSRGAFFSVVE